MSETVETPASDQDTGRPSRGPWFSVFSVSLVLGYYGFRRGYPLLASSPKVTEYDYDPLFGYLSKVAYPNGVITKYDHTPMGRTEAITHYGPDSTPEDLSDNPVLATYTYSYRDDGRRISSTETQSGNTTVTQWEYDNLGRLTKEIYDSHDDSRDDTTVFAYDLVGNRLEKQTNNDGDGAFDKVITFTCDANDRLTDQTV